MINDTPLARAFWNRGRVRGCPVYDMHGHMGTYGAIYFPRGETARMIETLDEAGVAMLCFSHHHALSAPDIGNAPAIKAVRAYPKRLRAYCALNANYPDTIRREVRTFDRYRDVYVGYKTLADYHGIPISAEPYKPAWEHADACGLLVLNHTWGGSANDGPGPVREVARRYPRAKILLGHSLHGDWDAAVEIAREFPNVYLELTAVLDDRGAIERFAAGAGSERMLFGTDLPWFDPHHGIGALLSADISDADRHNILHRNAEKLLAPFVPEIKAGR